jgi:ribosome biogenesis protein Nip4
MNANLKDSFKLIFLTIRKIHKTKTIDRQLIPIDDFTKSAIIENRTKNEYKKSFLYSKNRREHIIEVVINRKSKVRKKDKTKTST